MTYARSQGQNEKQTRTVKILDEFPKRHCCSRLMFTWLCLPPPCLGFYRKLKNVSCEYDRLNDFKKWGIDTAFFAYPCNSRFFRTVRPEEKRQRTDNEADVACLITPGRQLEASIVAPGGFLRQEVSCTSITRHRSACQAYDLHRCVRAGFSRER